MSDDAPTDPALLEAGRKLFAGPCQFVIAAASAGDLPASEAPEIAFVGRSNVGKSSLINALTGRRTLARTSHTPGRTQNLVFFDLGGVLRIVDMPGYGYAAVARKKAASWDALMRDYLRGRNALMRVFLLVDGRHGLKKSDLEMMALLDAAAASYAIVLTKRDEVKAAEAAAVQKGALGAMRAHPAAFPRIFFTSSRTGADIAELRAHIRQALTQRTAGKDRPA